MEGINAKMANMFSLYDLNYYAPLSCYRYCVKDLGPFVQSIVSLTMLLSKGFVKCIKKYYSKYKIWMLQSIKIFSSCKQLLLQNISAFNIVSAESFNILLTTKLR